MKAFNITLLAVVVGTSGLAIAESQFDKNMKNAEQVYKQQQAEKQRKEYQQYLRNKDHADGISQKSGPVGGRTSDGKGAWGGYQWSTK